MKTLFKNARILKMTGEDIFFGNLIVDGNRISYIGNEIPNDKYDQIIDCNGNVLMPGFKDCHTHSAMVFLRGYADDYSLQEWLFEKVIPAEEKFTKDDVYELTKLACLEYFSSGITAVMEMYYFPDMLRKAFLDMNMRAVIQLQATSYLNDGKLEEYYQTFNEKDSLVSAKLGLHAEYTSSPEDFALIESLVQKYKSPFYTHLSETKKEEDDCLKNRGMSATKYLESEGLFDYGGGGYHCVHLNDEDMEIFKKHNLSAILNTGSNTKLASGIPNVKKLLEHDINIAIGTDGAASNNCLNMFKEMALISSLSKVTTGDPSFLKAEEILKMATVNGAHAVGLNDCDVLEVGKLADIIMIDLLKPSMQPINNIVKNIVYAGSKDIVKMTMINGKIVYMDGKYNIGEDIEKMYQKCQQITDRLIK